MYIIFLSIENMTQDNTSPKKTFCFAFDSCTDNKLK